MTADLNIIRRLVLTERHSLDAEEHDPDKPKTYFFEVRKDATKRQIREALEKAFNLKNKIRKINTYIRPGKPKRQGRTRPGYSPERKRAVLYLKKGFDIPELQN